MGKIEPMKFKKYIGRESNFQQSAMELLDVLGKVALHVPNESKGTKAWHIKRKKQGLKKGFLDVLVLEAKKGYHGLVIELKTDGKYPTKEQYEWMDKLNAQGYYACWTDSFDEFMFIVTSYFSLERELTRDMFRCGRKNKKDASLQKVT